MSAAPNLPVGFRYRPELIGPDEEAALVARVRRLPFREFEFHGYTGKRRPAGDGEWCGRMPPAGKSAAA